MRPHNYSQGDTVLHASPLDHREVLVLLQLPPIARSTFPISQTPNMKIDAVAAPQEWRGCDIVPAQQLPLPDLLGVIGHTLDVHRVETVLEEYKG
jgi:hypothetical protein